MTSAFSTVATAIILATQPALAQNSKVLAHVGKHNTEANHRPLVRRVASDLLARTDPAQDPDPDPAGEGLGEEPNLDPGPEEAISTGGAGATNCEEFTCHGVDEKKEG